MSLPASQALAICPIPPALADDAPTIAALTTLITDAYTATEGDLLVPNHKRITAEGVRTEVASGQMYCVRDPAENTPIACIRSGLLAEQFVGPGARLEPILEPVPAATASLKPSGDHVEVAETPRSVGVSDPQHTGSFGLLAVAAGRQGEGLGGRLVTHVEEAACAAGCTEMEIQLLVPAPGTPSHGFKKVLERWYTRRGYRRVAVLEMEKFRAGISQYTARPCVFEIWRKAL